MDKKTRDDLILDNQKLIWGVIMKNYETYPMDIKNELYEEGLSGLIHAVDTYDNTKGSTLSTYITICVQNIFKRYFVNLYSKKRGGGKRPISLDEPIGEDGLTLIDLISGTDVKEEQTEYQEILDKLREQGDPYVILKEMVLNNFVIVLGNHNNKQLYMDALDIYFEIWNPREAARRAGLKSPELFYYLQKAFKKTRDQLLRSLRLNSQ